MRAGQKWNAHPGRGWTPQTKSRSPNLQWQALIIRRREFLCQSCILGSHFTRKNTTLNEITSCPCPHPHSTLSSLHPISSLQLSGGLGLPLDPLVLHTDILTQTLPSNNPLFPFLLIYYLISYP